MPCIPFHRSDFPSYLHDPIEKGLPSTIVTHDKQKDKKINENEKHSKSKTKENLRKPHICKSKLENFLFNNLVFS